MARSCDASCRYEDDTFRQSAPGAAEAADSTCFDINTIVAGDVLVLIFVYFAMLPFISDSVG
jgi:hypothetical protein